jgi:hypothetical protein
VTVDKSTKQLVNKHGGEMLMDLTKIKDNGTSNLCKMTFSNIVLPLEFVKEGYKFDTYCCALFQTEDGMETICHVNRPRCFYKMRRFARYMRKICIQDHAATAGLNINDSLALENFLVGAGGVTAPATPAPA